MSLNGTLDSFAIADVIRFLAGAQRSGVLTVDGDRGTVRLWIEGGGCTGAECAGSVLEDAVPAMLEALRNSTGTFSFAEGGPSPRRLAARPLLDVLAEAADLRAEWDSIELVLPSPRHRVRPALTPPEGRVVLDALLWRIVTSVGRSSEVGSLVARSGVGDLDAARAVVSLVRDGLLVVEPPEPTVVEAPEVVRSAVEVHATPSPPVDPFAGMVERFPIDDLVAPADPLDEAVPDPATGPGPAAPETDEMFSADAASALAEVVSEGISPVPPSEGSGGDPAFR